MVSGKSMEETKANGKQRISRGPSPNGHLSDGDSSTDDSEHGLYFISLESNRLITVHSLYLAYELQDVLNDQYKDTNGRIWL